MSAATHGHGTPNHYDTAADRVYFLRTWCECERPLPEPTDIGLVCEACGRHLNPQRAEALAGRCRHCHRK